MNMKGALLRLVLSVLTNIRLGWKGSPGRKNTLFGPFVNFGRKKFDNIGPRVNV